MATRPRRHRRFLYPAVAVLLTLVIAGCWQANRHRRQSAQLSAIYGGSVGLAALQSPATCRAWLLDRLPDLSQWRSAQLTDYPTRLGPVDVAPRVAGEIASLLRAPASYGWDYAKRCLITPGVRLRFADAQHAVDVLLCFECDILVVFVDGKNSGGEEFDAIRAELVAAVQAIFPEDELIGGLAP